MNPTEPLLKPPVSKQLDDDIMQEAVSKETSILHLFKQVSMIGLTTLVGAAVIQIAKRIVWPEITLDDSNVITMFFAAITAAFASFFVLRSQNRLRELVEAELKKRIAMEMELRGLNRLMEDKIRSRTSELEFLNRKLQEELSQREADQAALRDSHNKFSCFMEHLPGVAFLKSADGRVIFANAQYGRLCGLTSETMIGRNEAEFWPAGIADYFNEQDRKVLDSKTPHQFLDRLPFQSKDTCWLTNKFPVFQKDVPPLVGGVAIEITELKQTLKENENQKAAILGLAMALYTAEERERQAISVHLHDLVAQNLGLSISSLKLLAETADEKGLQDNLAQIVALLQTSLENTRWLTADLCPPVLQDFGTPAGLEELADEMQAVYGLTVHLDVAIDGPDMPVFYRMLVYRAVKELLTNAAKHARTPEAKVELRYTNDRVRVRVLDDGLGFDDSLLSERSGKRFGLFSIKTRIMQLDGVFRVRTAPRRGTEVYFEMPVKTL